MFRLRSAVLIVAAVLVSGCSTVVQLKPDPGPNQSIRYLDGRPLFLSTKKSQVGVLQEAQSFKAGDRTNVVISVANGAMTPFNFSPEDISFEVNGEAQRVYTYEELLAEQEERETWAAVAIALAGASNTIAASNAGYSYSSGTVSTRGYGANLTSTYSGYTYDASKVAAARASADAQMNANISAFSAASRETRAALQEQILKLNTVSPQSLVGGKVVFDLPTPKDEPLPAVLRVRAGEEVHEFQFMFLKKK